MNMTPPSEPHVRTRRLLSCTQCRKRKLRCDHNHPCSNCARSRNATCTYPYPAEPRRVTRIAKAPASGLLASTESSHSPLTQTDTRAAALETEIKRPNPEDPDPVEPGRRWHNTELGSILVDESHKDSPSLNAARIPTPAATQPSRTVTADSASHHPSPITTTLCNLSQPIRGVIVKTRFMSPNHWLYATSLAPHATGWWIQELQQHDGECWQMVESCKLLSRRVKTRRMLTWTYGVYGKYLPQRQVAKSLIDAYMRTAETIHRVLHVPTFRRDLDRFLDNPSSSPRAFLIQTQLCCAIGACVNDDSFSLRPDALQWIKEAESWLESEAKTRFTIMGVQIMCLTYLAHRGAQGVYGEHLWVKSGVLMRSAMCIGLHRDPASLPEMSLFEAEMRRRLWITVAEIVLDSSIDAGQSPLLSLDDFDCALPSNFNDDQLIPGSNAHLVPYPNNHRTDTSLQIAIGRTLAVRIAVLQCATSKKPEVPYDEIMRLNAEYTAVCRDLDRCLRAMNPEPPLFQQHCCYLVISRYIFALHIPFMSVALRNPAYYFSRRACLDAALKLAYSILPPKSSQEALMTAIQETVGPKEPCVDYTRLMLCGCGPFRSVQYQAYMVIAAELSAIVDEGSCIPRLRASSFLQPGSIQEIELRLLLDGAVSWAKNRMLAGQENIKDYIFLSIVSGHIQGAIDGVPVEASMRAKALESLGQAKDILRQMSGGESPPQERILLDTDCESNVVDVLSADDAADLHWGFFDTSTQDGFLWAGVSDFFS